MNGPSSKAAPPILSCSAADLVTGAWVGQAPEGPSRIPPANNKEKLYLLARALPVGAALPGCPDPRCHRFFAVFGFGRLARIAAVSQDFVGSEICIKQEVGFCRAGEHAV